MQYLFLFTIFLVSTCGLIYELVAGTLSSYLLGDSVTQFSTVIGVYLFSMGIGAYLSKMVHKNLLQFFIQVEILTGFVGGFSATILFLSFGYSDAFRPILYIMVVLIGTLIGLEIPIMMRILQDKITFSDLVSKVFTFDYVGALLASLLFPLFLVPHLGLIRTSALFGIINTSLAIYLLITFRTELNRYVLLLAYSFLTLLLLLIGFVFANEIMQRVETEMYGENIIYSNNSAYQRIVLTRKKQDLRLYLNNNLQFSSVDEYRYHEALVHPAVGYAPNATSVLILGGGDGMAARELQRYPQIKNITLVDLDIQLTDLFKNNAVLRKLNLESLNSKSLHIINDDAFRWIRNTKQTFDIVIIDFPDPSNYAIGKLYTTAFYRSLSRVMKEQSIAVVQSTSPLVAPNTYWCVGKTLTTVGFETMPYHLYVPSFGEWGFFMFAKALPKVPHLAVLPKALRYFNWHEFNTMRHFSTDMLHMADGVQRLDNQVLVEYFEKEWAENL
jgi:spermidine synthase